MCNGLAQLRHKLVTRLIFAWCKTGLRTWRTTDDDAAAAVAAPCSSGASLFRHSFSSHTLVSTFLLFPSSFSLFAFPRVRARAVHVIVSLARHVVHIKNRAVSGNNFSASSICFQEALGKWEF